MNKKNREYTCCFTGHRPDKLYGYDMSVPQYKILIKEVQKLCVNLIEDHKVQYFISGGALGFDTIAFVAVHNLKQQYPYIKNILAIPFKNNYIKWTKKDIEIFNWMKNRADEIVYVDTLKGYTCPFVSIGEYASNKLQTRNEYMVDNSKYIIAKFNRGKGGTYNCLKYAINTYQSYIKIIYCSRMNKY